LPCGSKLPPASTHDWFSTGITYDSNPISKIVGGITKEKKLRFEKKKLVPLITKKKKKKKNSKQNVLSK
jgi:hypothetical protein